MRYPEEPVELQPAPPDWASQSPVGLHPIG